MRSHAETGDVGIIGAGPAGLAAAYALAKAGVAVEVFDGSAQVGGMAGSFSLWGQTVDLGPHRFFSTDARVNQLWTEVLGAESGIVDRLTRIYYERKFFDYPLRAMQTLRRLGLYQSTACVASYVLARLHPRRDESSFENWVINRFGARLYRMFFKSYSEKLWGIPCTLLDADFAAQRIKKFSLLEAIKAALRGNKGSKHKTLVDQFSYPFHGTGSFYEKMARLIEEKGGRIHLSTPVRSVTRAADGALSINLADGTVRPFQWIVSSMPLTDLVLGFNPPAEIVDSVAKLRFRNTILVYLEIQSRDLFPDQWIYVHSPALAVGRITNFRNWLPTLCGDSQNTIVCMEYWCYDDDAIWRSPDADLVATATSEIQDTQLIGATPVLNGKVIRLRKSYPVYRRGYRDDLAKIEHYLSGIQHLFPIGRYGSFKYNNQDHSILMGVMVAQNIMGQANHDLWRVNTDDEYQEAGAVLQRGGVMAPPIAEGND
ncbi:MAG: FAD-dependent oxidoreductase [Azospirillaceae bacterium]|nr:FAD-dependent oxidoreductase [Azospirillaceae bacterium]